ncbi:MAG: hypothetical protein OEV31_08345 [Gammaproteobacteria bacterium]|nr:hypothetical protein [Gammaproteobacteria bacterium]
MRTISFASFTTFTALALLSACSKPAPAPVSATLLRPALALKPGNGRISIPPALVIDRNGIPGVFVWQENTARFRMVRPGKTRDGRVEILSGLLGTETLVAGDLRAVIDGTPVAPTTGAAPRAKR